MAKTVVKKGFGFFSLILAFLFGVICAVGGAAFAVYYVVTQVKIKDAVQSVSSIAGISVSYSDIITEEYAEKTVFELLGSAQTLASKANDGTLSLNDLNAISPMVKGLAQGLADILNENLCVSLSVEGEGGLLSTPLNGMGDLLFTQVMEVPVATLLQKLSPEMDLSQPVLKALLYDDEGEPKGLNEIGGVFSEGENGETAFDDLKLKELIPVDENSNAVIKELADCTIKQLRDEGITDELDDLTIEDLLGSENIPATNKLLDTIKGCNVKTLKEDGITNKLDGLTIEDLLGDGYNNNALLTTVAKYTIGDLKTKDITAEIKISDVISINEENAILKAIKDTPLNKVGTTLNDLTIQEIYADEIYVDDGNGGTKLKGHWKYLLTDKYGVVQNYTVNDIDAMITNMETNVQKAQISDLVTNKIISVDDEADLGKTLTFWSQEKNAYDSKIVGEMSLQELIRAAMTFAKKLPE